MATCFFQLRDHEGVRLSEMVHEFDTVKAVIAEARMAHPEKIFDEHRKPVREIILRV